MHDAAEHGFQSLKRYGSILYGQENKNSAIELDSTCDCNWVRRILLVDVESVLNTHIFFEK
jgi:hypothetical protein